MDRFTAGPIEICCSVQRSELHVYAHPTESQKDTAPAATLHICRASGSATNQLNRNCALS
jgi:hypothetical protein